MNINNPSKEVRLLSPLLTLLKDLCVPCSQVILCSAKPMPSLPSLPHPHPPPPSPLLLLVHSAVSHLVLGATPVLRERLKWLTLPRRQEAIKPGSASPNLAAGVKTASECKAISLSGLNEHRNDSSFSLHWLGDRCSAADCHGDGMKVLSENNQPRALSAPAPLAAGLWQSLCCAGLS